MPEFDACKAANRICGTDYECGYPFYDMPLPFEPPAGTVGPPPYTIPPWEAGPPRSRVIPGDIRLPDRPIVGGPGKVPPRTLPWGGSNIRVPYTNWHIPNSASKAAFGTGVASGLGASPNLFAIKMVLVGIGAVPDLFGDAYKWLYQWVNDNYPSAPRKPFPWERIVHPPKPPYDLPPMPGLIPSYPQYYQFLVPTAPW